MDVLVLDTGLVDDIDVPMPLHNTSNELWRHGLFNDASLFAADSHAVTRGWLSCKDVKFN